MRTFLSLAASLLLAGCPPASKSPPPSSPDPTPTPTPATPAQAAAAPEPTPTATPEIAPDTPSPPETSVAAPTTPAEPPRSRIAYEGIWTTQDAQGQAFDIVIFPNGQAVTNWAKGVEGARGERGYWRQDEQRLTAVYSDGSTDIIEPYESGFRHRRYSAGSPLDSQPTAQTEATRAEGNEAALVGVWRLNKEPDGSHLYIVLQSSGRAISTVAGGTEGKWKANEKGALCEWPDGWVDQIERGTAGWQKRSWIGSESSAPADLSLATRVGETRFSVEP
ncbi:MAG TPA: hypothetical protein VIS96_12485 [Terrimicrobiaceae bacterium]